MINAYLRADGRKGIRNTLVVAYLVECAHHVSREIYYPFREQGAHLIGFPGCFPNVYSHQMMERLCTHPNVGGALLVSLGCEGFNKGKLQETIRRSGRPVKLLEIQGTGGTRKTIAEGKAWIEQTLKQLENTPRANMELDELIVGTICGGSDATSGLTANPAMGRAFDFLVEKNATCIFEETGELIGMEHWMAKRAENPALGEEIIKTVAKAAKYYATYGHASIGPGNADGGLTTIEEKSLGATHKAGERTTLEAVVGYAAPITAKGLTVMDTPGLDVESVTGMVGGGAQIVIFTTGLGTPTGNPIAPVVKITGNSRTAVTMADNTDLDVSGVISETESLDAAADRLMAELLTVCSGKDTAAERLGHREFAIHRRNSTI